MSHPRSRFLFSQIAAALKWSRTISLLGMRQVGKTTLVRSLAETYLTLDDDSTLIPLQMGEWGNIEKAKSPLALDECQKLPSLFDRVKLIVDARKKPGQFILTGSVRFLSRRQIRESLTGRTVMLELLPMTLAESHRQSQFDFIRSIPTSRKESTVENWMERLQTRNWSSSSEIDHQIAVGGLPGICFRREPHVRNQLLDVHLETLLSRDIQFLYPTRISSVKLRELLRQVALDQGLPFRDSRSARIIGTSSPTLKRLMTALEGLFLVRRHGKTYFIEDSGISEHLLRTDGGLPARQRNLGFLFRETLALLNYRYHGEYDLKEYRTRGGAEVPFVVSVQGKKIALTIDSENVVSEKSLMSMASLLKQSQGVFPICVHRGTTSYLSGSGIPCVPMQFLI